MSEIPEEPKRSLFSERRGLRSLRQHQLDGADDDLRNRLWSVLHRRIWTVFAQPLGSLHAMFARGQTVYNGLFDQYWDRIFKRPVDQIPSDFAKALNTVRAHFFDCEWYEVFDILELTINYPLHRVDDLESDLNVVLQEECSGHRAVRGKFVPITSPTELRTVETALQESEPLEGVNTHLSRAAEFLSDRESPDYRNSIKESVSAVESMAKLMSGKPNAVLGDALRTIESSGHIHPALKEAMTKLYGYTSDEGGIRHAMLEETDISFAEAKYMLVACSGFVSYLVAKAAQLQIDIVSPDATAG